MDLGGRDPAQLVAAYASRYRAQYSDDDIRAALRGQGFAPEAIEDGLRLAGPREGPPAPPAPEPAVPAPGRGLLKKLLIGAGVLGVLGVLALAALILLVPSKSKRAKKTLPPELANYKPEKLSDPAHLPAFLPEGLEEGDAGEDYARIIAGRMGVLREPGGFERLRADPSLTPAETLLLESALRKRRCSILGVHLAPDSFPEHLSYVAAMAGFLPAAVKQLKAPAERAQQAKDWAEMTRHGRRTALFGWHMAQEWDTTTQLLGSSALVGGILHQSIARKSARGEFADLEAAKASLDLLAYSGEKEVYAAIVQDAGRPDRLAGLASRLEDPRARRPYAAWTLQFAATAFTPEEAQAAAAAPQRAAFLEGYARDPDPRMAALGAAYGRLLRGVEREYGSVAPERRGELHEKISRRLAGMSKRRE